MGFQKAVTMKYSTVFKVIFVMFINCEIYASEEEIDLTFPSGFNIGTAIAAFQVEGAWNISGKSESFWDHIVHNNPYMVKYKMNADTTCDFYHKYKEDIKMLKDIGLKHFRFSISWARIFNNESTTNPNPSGVRFYHNILDELEKQGIEPIVTIYHWDHPQILENFGAWHNEHMVDVFADFARFIFQEFGPRVKTFVTINEPLILCGLLANILSNEEDIKYMSKYMCIQNVLKAHAMAYHIYDKEFRHEQNGKIGIALVCCNYYSKNENDSISSDIAFDFDCGLSANTIFSKEGDYPEIVKQRLRETIELKNLSISLLPTLSDYWIKKIRGSSDFFGLNHYTSYLVEPRPKNRQQHWPGPQGLQYSVDPSWRRAESSWLSVVPQGFGNLLRKIKEKYENPEVHVLECGVSDNKGVNDNLRIYYLYFYLKEMLIAIKRDKCNVKSFFVWSFLDSFEWLLGYKVHFGIVKVDFESANLTRTYKRSVAWLKDVLKSHKLVYPRKYYYFRNDTNLIEF